MLALVHTHDNGHFGHCIPCRMVLLCRIFCAVSDKSSNQLIRHSFEQILIVERSRVDWKRSVRYPKVIGAPPDCGPHVSQVIQ